MWTGCFLLRLIDGLIRIKIRVGIRVRGRRCWELREGGEREVSTARIISEDSRLGCREFL